MNVDSYNIFMDDLKILFEGSPGSSDPYTVEDLPPQLTKDVAWELELLADFWDRNYLSADPNKPMLGAAEYHRPANRIQLDWAYRRVQRVFVNWVRKTEFEMRQASKAKPYHGHKRKVHGKKYKAKNTPRSAPEPTKKAGKK